MMSTKQHNINVRINKSLLERIDLLINTDLVSDEQIAHTGVLKRSDIVRIALSIGLAELEKRVNKS